MPMNDVLGQAIYDHYHSSGKYKLWIHNKYGPKEEMPVETFFRNPDEFPELEWLALKQCRGRILDIGAGAGSHALFLQNNKANVTAIDISPLTVKVMQQRGVERATVADIKYFNDGKFDTLLMLMNGIGIAGTLNGLKALLTHLKTMLNDGGQILFDSSDIAYLYEGNLPKSVYYGEIDYQYQYKNNRTDWFKWLYVDKQTLQSIANELGFITQILMEDDYDQYLVKFSL